MTKRYRVEGSKVLHEDKNCSYLDKTKKEKIHETSSNHGDMCDRCAK